MTPTEALDRIAALCDDAWAENGAEDGERVIGADDVREILAEVSPEPGGVLDRDALRKAVAPVIWNASNYPRKAQPYILGQDTGPLTDAVVAAVAARLEAAQ